MGMRRYCTFGALQEEAFRRVVEENDKQRFKTTWEGSDQLIRANQGHSLSHVLDSTLYTTLGVNAMDVCVHGTYFSQWNSILEHGLLTGSTLTREVQGEPQGESRLHIHLTRATPRGTSAVSGARPNCDLFIYIDYGRAVERGVVFYLSDNGVILTRGLEGRVPSELFRKVEKRK